LPSPGIAGGTKGMMLASAVSAAMRRAWPTMDGSISSGASRSDQGASTGITRALLELNAPFNSENPATEITLVTPGISSSCCSSRPSWTSVRPRDAASGSCASMKK
jgi:hypothetical protein